MADSARVPARPSRREEPLQRLLFGGVYGTVLASAMASALGNDGGLVDPGYDALWVLLAGLASAAAHGYAHTVAHLAEGDNRVSVAALRSVLTEWPLVAAVLPTVASLLGAYAGWWSEVSAINAALGVNTALLFCWGLWSARVAGRPWAAACRVGAVDVLIGLLIVLANALSK